MAQQGVEIDLMAFADAFLAEDEVAGLVGDRPDEGKEDRVAVSRSDGRRNQIAADDPGDREGDDEMKAQERRTRREDARSVCPLCYKADWGFASV